MEDPFHIPEEFFSINGSNVHASDVKRELNGLYHELSKKHHHPKLTGVGLVCGGDFPLRTATALALLKLQDLTGMPYEIIYTDKDYNPVKRMNGGNVINY